MPEAVDIRERTRTLLRKELRDVAVDLFISQGVEATTVDDIARAAGTSRRTFFRYFAGKEDVLRQEFDAARGILQAALAQRPSDEPPWTSLHHVLAAVASQMNTDSRCRALTKMVVNDRALTGIYDGPNSWLDALTEGLTARPNGASQQLQSRALAGAALACFIAARDTWAQQEHPADLAQLVGTAMTAVHDIAGSHPSTL
ncbi:TetR family transcriptional regulator [Mycolicibacterium sp. J2]|uniref:TetR family transcriptional regulator n=1 Tax=Mycolicibacterium sp. J2 TaxID=2993511 RepID=UPI00224B9F04|nr:TetR family transcriptional regulator [Mycolicibacterium sp. J2]MCX2715350.1 TetR family transcriptional regulator [Mycolicibacterium sp. J2]